jgi:hypothetical protein
MMNPVRMLLATIVLGTLTLGAPRCPGEIPSGALNYTVDDPVNALWDVTGVYNLNHPYVGIADISADIWFDVDFTQNGAGKLSGAGTTSILVHSDYVYGTIANATYKVTGTINSKNGVATLRYSATATATTYVDGRATRVSATGSRVAILDARSKLLSGTYKNKASASGIGGGTDTGSLPETWWDVEPYLGDGAWALSLALENDGGKKITGEAAVTLSTGAVCQFLVKGVYNAKTDTSKLVLSPLPGFKGASLKVQMLGDSITAIKGKISGQSINIVVAP